MPERQIDPARLEGEALRRWYLRSPDEIAEEREARQAQRYQAFFGARSPETRGDPGFAHKATRQTAAPGEDILWIANGRGGYRAVRPDSDFQTTLQPSEDAYPNYLPDNAAAAESGELLNVGNPQNRRLKQEYIKKQGYWPKTADGRDYDVSHIRAIGDGGTNTLDNIEPMDPDEHRAKHRRDGDSQRFGKRAGIARAFGGKVEPPAHGPRPARSSTVKGFALWDVFPNITGILSGRIRTDNLNNFANDIAGRPSAEDIQRRDEEMRRRYFPNSKPGDLIA